MPIPKRRASAFNNDGQMMPQLPGYMENIPGNQAFAFGRIVNLHRKFADAENNQRVYLL